MNSSQQPLVLTFPFNRRTPVSGRELIFHSSEIVGAGSVRRHQVQELCVDNRVHLIHQTNYFPDHLAPYFELELVKTLSWMRPATTTLQPLDFLTAQKILFPKLFPKTIFLLGDMATRQRDLYLNQMDVGSWLLQDHWRYFAGFLRQQFPAHKTLMQVSHWEWTRAWLEVQTLSEGQTDSEFLRLEGSLQTVRLEESAAAELSKPPGLYALWSSPEKNELQELCLGPVEAVLLDTLQEDRKYRASQLVEMARLEFALKLNVGPDEWENKFLSLCNLGIIRGGLKQHKESL